MSTRDRIPMRDRIDWTSTVSFWYQARGLRDLPSSSRHLQPYQQSIKKYAEKIKTEFFFLLYCLNIKFVKPSDTKFRKMCSLSYLSSVTLHPMI